MSTVRIAKGKGGRARMAAAAPVPTIEGGGPSLPVLRVALSGVCALR